MGKPLPIGKLPADILRRLLSAYVMTDERVILGPAVGEDAAVIDFGDRYLVAKADPITFATDEIGWYAVHVNANDIACTGAVPKWFLATLLLPAGQADEAMAEKIFGQLSQASHALGITLCGGHTEITYGIDRPLIAGLMLGELKPENLIRTSGAQIGDAILLTKGIAIEGTALIAREKAEELSKEFDEEFLRRCQDLLHDPGISVVRDARIIQSYSNVHAMHDPTEGGLSTALYELSEAAGVGLIVEEEHIPIRQETVILCRRYGLDPLGLISSGALLACLPKDQGETVLHQLHVAGLEASVIGTVLPKECGVHLRRSRSLLPGEQQRKGVTSDLPLAQEVPGNVPLPVFDRDEIARLFEG